MKLNVATRAFVWLFTFQLTAAQCETQSIALGSCLDALLSEAQENACEACLDQAALNNAAGDCAAVETSVCDAFSACTQCSQVSESCKSEIFAKMTCEANDARTDLPNASACPVFTCVGMPVPATTDSPPVPTTDPSTPSAPLDEIDCVSQDIELGNCLERILTEVEEESCEACLDVVALESASGDCSEVEAVACSAFSSCNECVPAINLCRDELYAKLTCETNDARTDLRNSPACPLFTCSASLFDGATP